MMLAAITTELLAALAVAFPATDQVQVGTFTQPPTSGAGGFVAVAPPALVAESQQRERWDRCEATYRIRCWAPFTTEAPAGRTVTATSLARSVKSAVQVARRGAAPGTALAMAARVAVNEVALDQAAAGLPPNWSAADLVVVVRYFTPVGV